RASGDIVEVAAGSRVSLEARNAVIASGGALLHGRGRPRGESSGGPLRMTLRQITARVEGGLVRLESSPEEPNLPRAEVTARDSIFATTAAGDPLFHVDGQDDLDALREIIHWEGEGVAYHQIRTYRRDSIDQPGSLPINYGRSAWEVAA